MKKMGLMMRGFAIILFMSFVISEPAFGQLPEPQVHPWLLLTHCITSFINLAGGSAEVDWAHENVKLNYPPPDFLQITEGMLDSIVKSGVYGNLFKKIEITPFVEIHLPYELVDKVIKIIDNTFIAKILDNIRRVYSGVFDPNRMGIGRPGYIPQNLNSQEKKELGVINRYRLNAKFGDNSPEYHNTFLGIEADLIPDLAELMGRRPNIYNADEEEWVTYWTKLTHVLGTQAGPAIQQIFGLKTVSLDEAKKKVKGMIQDRVKIKDAVQKKIYGSWVMDHTDVGVGVVLSYFADAITFKHESKRTPEEIQKWIDDAGNILTSQIKAGVKVKVIKNGLNVLLGSTSIVIDRLVGLVFEEAIEKYSEEVIEDAFSIEQRYSENVAFYRKTETMLALFEKNPQDLLSGAYLKNALDLVIKKADWMKNFDKIVSKNSYVKNQYSKLSLNLKIKLLVSWAEDVELITEFEGIDEVSAAKRVEGKLRDMTELPLGEDILYGASESYALPFWSSRDLTKEGRFSFPTGQIKEKLNFGPMW